MSSPGSAQDNPSEAEAPTLSRLYLTLGPVVIIAGVYFLIFLILRKSQRRWYAPRTYIGSLRESERSPELPNGLFNWFGRFWKIPDVHALQHQSLDAFLYLRYMKMTIVLTFVGCCITWPILFPVNITGGNGRHELNRLTYSNIDNKTDAGKNRYFAHVFTAWVYYGFVLFLIFRECIYYINLRQAFLLSPFYSQRISSRTVLFTSVPTPFLDERKLRKMFGPSVKNVWITGDTEELDKLVEERDKAAFKLEKSEVKLIKLANKQRLAAIKGGAADEKAVAGADAESGSIAAKWVPQNKRPSHRTGLLGLLGKKVDSIDWCRTELARLIPAVEAEQAKYRAGASKKIPGVFIEFRTQGEAETAFQVIAHHQGLHMSPRHIGITPSDVVWKSLTIPWWQKVIRRYLVLAFIGALIIFWAIPVAVVGTISNVSYLKTISFLTWLDKVPEIVMGLISGLLPAVALSILLSLVPVVMRLCARLSGEPSHSRVELFTQNAYFCFLVIQVFLVSTMSSAASAVAKQISEQPQKVTEILATNLPTSSTYYISFFIVQGFTIAAAVLSQVVGFVIFTLLYKYLAGTPRALYTKWANLSAISWGSTLPIYTNICVIAITYAVIAPLLLGWACVGMCLFYFAWRYNVLFVTDTKIDTRGLIYPRALKQLFTGVYLSELCMIGLFGASAAPIPLALMVVFLIFTVLFHISMNSALDPLLYNLPQSLLAEEESRLTDLEAVAGSGAVPAKTQFTDLEAVARSDAGPAEKNGATNGKAAELPVVHKKPNFLTKFLKPWIYSDYATLRELVPQHEDVDLRNLYTDVVNRDAYFPPTVTSVAPLLWIPEDAAGVSKQEIAHTSKVIPITDEGCTLDDKGNMIWDREATRPPVWEEKVLY